MRLKWLTACVVCTMSIFSGEPVVASRYTIFVRQDGQSTPSSTAISNSAVRPTNTGPAAASSTNEASSTASVTGSGIPLSQSSASSSTPQAPGSTESSLNATSKTTSISITSTSTASGSMATVTNGTLEQPGTASMPVRLPLKPTITPALAVAGAILILSGAVYSLIGIKNRRLHIALSTAFLSSLSVTVLIVYVSNPPVSNAVQGAYFVAAFITGVVLGAASLIFTDVTEGLGCLLGGFCVSMWFLVLKAGGLITSTGGKAGFIVAFCLVAYALSFNSYTRPYGLIGGTSFAGATAVVIGIDCYSRAGLKEFWLYLWALNGNIFPLGTSTYPITRGIRVEIACIIVFFLLGIMSQLKIWKVIKERRQQKMERLQDEEQRREQNEEELGRKLEDANSRERARWEAVYGDKEEPTIQHVDSGIGSGEFGSVRKGSTSIIETGRVEEPIHETIEMENLEVETRPNEAGSITQIRDAIKEDKRRSIRLGQEEDPTLGDGHTGSLGASAATNNVFSEPKDVSVVDDLPAATKGTALTLQDDQGQESACQQPGTSGEVSVPPQVTPLPFTIPSPDIDDASSMAVSAASDYFPPCKKNRLSGASLFKTLSKQSRQSRLASSSEEALAVPEEFDDRRSTPSGTASINSLHGDHKKEEITTADERGKDRTSMKRKPVPLASSPRSECSLDAANVVNAQAQSQSDDVTQSLGLAKSVVPSEPFSGRLPSATLSEHLPEGGSPLVITYRTNEWAKHLDRAEKPGLDELDSSVNELRPGNEHVDEVPVPVDVEGLQQTSEAPQTAQSSSPPNLDSLPNPRNLQANADPSVSANNQSSASMRPTTQQPTILVARACRGNSAPLNGQPLAESPIEEGVETSFPPRIVSPMPNNTLMAKRDNLLRNRYSSTTLAHPPLLAVDQAAEIMPSDSASVHSNVASSIDDDNIPLSQRRSILRHGKRHTSLPQIQASSPNDIPQPLRSPSALTDLERRDLMLTSWRTSVRQELNSNTVPQIQSKLDARRTELMNEKYRLGLDRQQKAITASYRDSMIDQAMRSGDMLDVHREAMRKMQAAANKNV